MIRSRAAGLFTLAVALALVFSAPADARRGGSFGSRGSRTYSAPSPTRTAPGYTAPVQRSMTPQPGYQGGFQPGYASAPYQQPFSPRTGGFGRGFGGGLLGGLVTGGLIGGMMGHGWGGGGFGGGYGGGMGGGGLLTILLQLAIVGGGIWLLMRLFRRPPAMVGTMWPGSGPGSSPSPWASPTAPFATSVPVTGGSSYPGPDLAITPSDQAAFERLLIEVQDAFGREDYAGLRARSTPEVMSFLAEELSENATHGRRNQVTGTRLLQSDVSEAWSEAGQDYATVALRYESVDVMVDRTTGAVIQGDPKTPTATTELWTFVRPPGGAWKLTAIQEPQ
jgi:predicted lipid-binding transport protein (Tim44 family)